MIPNKKQKRPTPAKLKQLAKSEAAAAERDGLGVDEGDKSVYNGRVMYRNGEPPVLNWSNAVEMEPSAVPAEVWDAFFKRK